MSGEGGTSCEVELVTCTLSELSSCLCLNDASKIVGSGRRKHISDYVDVPPEDIFLSARRTIWTNKPTLIDRLIFWHRAALAMGPKKVRTTVNSSSTSSATISGVKRKRYPEGSSSSTTAPPPKKRPLLQVKKEAALCRKAAGNSPVKVGKKKNVGNDQGTNRYATRISQNKVRIPFSLRSGRKLADILKNKRLRAKKDAAASSNAETSEANGVKNDDSKTTKKDGNTVKKNVNVPVKKENTVQTKSSVPQNKTATKNKFKTENASKLVKIDDNLLKKKRRKRKRCSMWSNKTRKVRKKDQEAGEADEAEGSSAGEDEEDETGVMSDVSLLSTATLDSSLSAAPPILVKQENLITDNCSLTNVIKTEEGLIKSENIKVEVDKEIDESITTDESIVFCNDLNSAIYVKSVNPDGLNVDSMSSVVTNSSETNLKSSPHSEGNSVAKSEPTSVTLSTTIENIDLPVVDSVAQNDVNPTAKTEVLVPLESICNLVNNNEPQTSELVIEKCETLTQTTLPDVNHPLDTKEVTMGVPDCTVSVNSITDSKCDNGISLNETTSIQNQERTEVPEQVPLKNDKEAEVEGGEATAATENESELKRDADSTTCDNPRGMDDSFGDLSLYVSEDDLTGSNKEHDEELPDSTNISQGDHCVGDDEVQLSPLLKVEEKPNTQFLETETAVEPSESEEQKQMKESVLHALGLKSLSNLGNETLEEEKPPKRSDGYTGTLKAVIKLNRTGDKKHMVYKRAESALASSDKLEYRICSEVGSEESKKLSHEQIEESEDDGTNEDGSSKEPKLIIPEKSSSFSIHPGRLCSDVCSYCFGKFGSLDTPCHVAQLKGEERQKKILENEPHLTGESCLCDACYRYVDRKANFPEKLKVGRLKPPAQASICCVTHCSEPATRTIKRKWLIKLKKSITNKLNIDMEKLGHGVYYPFCTQHHYWVEYFTICGICRKRLNRNNLFSLGAEADRLNLMLAEDGIPARLSVNLFLCKLCRYYADLRLKYPDPSAIPASNQNFYKNYRRKILMSLDIPVSDSDDELLNPPDEPKKNLEGNRDDKADEDVMSLSGLATLLGEQPQQQARIQVKFGNVNIGTLSNLNIGQQGGNASSAVAAPAGAAAASAGVNGSSSHHKNEPTYPEVSLVANFEYQGPNTPDGSWERYQSTLQFDKKTKQLWTELQRPYGSQTSFLRHLVMLERVWRDGYLILAPDADEAASRYITSARNRIRAFETQGPKMSTSAPTTSAPTIPVQTTSPSTCSATVTRPTPSISVGRKPPTTGQTFPFLTNTGEIEVTPIRSKASPIIQQQLQQQPLSVISKSLSQPVAISISSGVPKVVGGTASQFTGHSLPQQLSFNHKINQPRKITPLDRAKSLVRMAPMYQQIQQHHQGGVERRGQPGPVRYMGAAHSVGSIPPLVRLPQTQPTQYYQPPVLQQQQIRLTPQQQIQQHINMQQQSYFLTQQIPQQRMPLPKLPRQLTVMSMPPRPALPQAITLSHSGITIEKQIAPSRTSSLPVERPSISVFREPATP